MRVNNMTLVKIGAIGGMLTVSMGLAARFKISENIKKTEYYKDALKTVRTNKGAVYLLGEPMKDGRVDIGNSEKNFTKDDKAQYEVPVKGPKQKGMIYFWAAKQDTEWVVKRIELGLQNEPNRRLLIKNINEQ
jgi:cytochrome c oxidase assembly factor 1